MRVLHRGCCTYRLSLGSSSNSRNNNCSNSIRRSSNRNNKPALRLLRSLNNIGRRRRRRRCEPQWRPPPASAPRRASAGSQRAFPSLQWRCLHFPLATPSGFGGATCARPRSCNETLRSSRSKLGKRRNDESPRAGCLKKRVLLFFLLRACVRAARARA